MLDMDDGVEQAFEDNDSGNDDKDDEDNGHIESMMCVEGCEW